MDIYNHVMEDADQQAAEQLDTLLEQRPATSPAATPKRRTATRLERPRRAKQ